MTAAGMQYQIDAAAAVPVRLDEMIAASQRAQTAVSLANIHPVGAVQLSEVNLLRKPVRLGTHAEARRNE